MYATSRQTTQEDLPSQRERLERHARDLRELGQIGMDLARLTHRESYTASNEPGVLGEISLSFARVSRAVRQGMALEAEIGEAIDRLDNPAKSDPAKENPAKDDPVADKPQTPPAQQTNRVKRLKRLTQLRMVIGGAISHQTPEEIREDLLGDLDDYLLADRLKTDLEHLPASEIIDRICRDLDFQPKPPLGPGATWHDEMPPASRYPGVPDSPFLWMNFDFPPDPVPAAGQQAPPGPVSPDRSSPDHPTPDG